MIEPAAYGAAVSFGPNTRNFRDIVAALLAADSAVVVHDARRAGNVCSPLPRRAGLRNRCSVLALNRSFGRNWGRRAAPWQLLESLLDAAE